MVLQTISEVRNDPTPPTSHQLCDINHANKSNV